MARTNHAIITGGSSGIGAAVAAGLAKRGHAVTLLARGREQLEATAQMLVSDIGAQADNVQTQVADVCDVAALDNAIAQCQSALGPCTHLVCCAGIVRPGRFENLTTDDFRKTMEVNYLGTVNAVRAVYPAMVTRRNGHISLVSSGAGLIGIFGYSAYAPSKFAVKGFAEVLRAEAKSAGIGVSVCFPPDTDTPQLAEELRSRPPETQAIAGNAKVWRADDIAEAMIKGMQRGRFAIYPGWEMAGLGWLGSLLQPALNWQFDRIVSRVGGK